MRLTQLHDIPGLTIDDKLQRIIDTADGRQVWVQPKYNGVMGVWNNGNMWTRNDKKYKPGAFCTEFYKALSVLPQDHIVYGELTIPGIPFQDAIGLLSVSRIPIGLGQAQFIVHDIFDTNRFVQEQTYKERLALLKKLISNETTTGQYLNRAQTYGVQTRQEIQNFFGRITADGGEGIVIRAEPAFICVSTNSPQIIKWKKTEDGEGICTSVYEGLGKLKGTLGGFVVRLPSGVHVNIGGGKGLNDTMRDKLWVNPPIGKSITFAYEMLSSAGVPLKPQFLSVRDYE